MFTVILLCNIYRATVFRGKFCQILRRNLWNSLALLSPNTYILRPVGVVVLTDISKYKEFIVTYNTKTHYFWP